MCEEWWWKRCVNRRVVVGKYISWGKGGGEHCTVRIGMPKKPEARKREVEASVVKRCPAGLPVSVPEVPGSFQWERRDSRSAGEWHVHRQNGSKDMGGWRKEPLAKKNRTRLFVCGKTHLKNISLNVYKRTVRHGWLTHEALQLPKCRHRQR